MTVGPFSAPRSEQVPRDISEKSRHAIGDPVAETGHLVEDARILFVGVTVGSESIDGLQLRLLISRHPA